MNKTELLAPAGSFEVGKAALYAGCDAIYLALDTFGARAYAKNFTKDELVEILNIAHALDKKVYVTVNIVFHDKDLTGVEDYLKELKKYADSDDPEDKKIFEEMLKEYEAAKN